MEANGSPDPIIVQGDFYDFLKMRRVRVLDDAKDDVIVEEVAMVEDETVRKAVKKVIMLDSNGNPKCEKPIINEILIMHRTKHTCLMHLDSMAVSAGIIAIIMPLCSKGSIGGMLETITRDQRDRYFVQISCALRYLHKNRIIHGDVKPGNVLVDASDKAILADFGHSRYLQNGKDYGCIWGGSKGFVGPEFFTSKYFNMFLVSANFL